MIFEVGDKVDAFGVPGIIEGIDTMAVYPIKVRFNNEYFCSFTKDGKSQDWHKDPSLIFVSREAKKTKVKLYPALLRERRGVFISTFLFKTQKEAIENFHNLYGKTADEVTFVAWLNEEKFCVEA